ncbi:eukaryotic translation initiation factor 4 gamma 1-like isoform X1 [Diorhabda sublineata]|uniref:eukaryotic translation initiation factor 4 gamma 1-like isoform X1 n=1 Tax=Diorhabda sublineata TaxID=1163346 RepID=UPI0024E04C1A|nr:eukaryotic translation initiation factor 4 gamma 1-like isoform X1 [Diorhabda sublineata]XP_056649017.1 eukaryotic translation initiation factor 4 gamma 1-like isoform X1 [Diorhabda sublineata]XP_056649026.1 eukaryotic translation initiation factor 4 gamma 1-like isoform X1 [Diorhabda sublineata]
MSSNQKQTAAGGPQTQRYTSSPYQPIPTAIGHEYDYYYRPEGYPVSAPPGTYVQPPPNQGGNQGPTLRGPSVPPNQSSTPPNADIKVSTLTQQPSLNPMFVAPNVRPPAANFYPRPSGPPSQPQRMTSHNNRPQQGQLYTSSQAPQFMHVAATPQVYLASTNSVPYAYGTQRPAAASYVQTLPVYPHLYSYPSQSQTPPVSYGYFPQMMPRTASMTPVTVANSNNTQNPIPPVNPLPTNHHQFRQPRNKRQNAIPVIDPVTGADRLQEMYEENPHPPSGDTSARQTPQPANNQSHTKEVQATFAKLVIEAIEKDTRVENQPPPPVHQLHVPTHPQEEQHHSDHISDGQQTNQVVIEHDSIGSQRQGAGPVPQVPQQQHQLKMDHVLQSSKLQADAKEFILPPTVLKETPIVSANIDAVEVTLPNKLPKEKESPAKGRKQREQSARTGEHIVKEAAIEKTLPVSVPSNKETICDQDSSILKDEVKSVQDVPSSLPMQSTNPTQVSTAVKENVAPKEITSDKIQQQQRPQQNQQHTRKDVKEAPAKTVLERQDSASSVGSIQNISQENSKSKNAQRSASKQGTGGQNNNQKSVAQAQVSVPQPQPAKAASKSNKKNELNLKGANKEGTDMDAFNDNIPTGEVNSNVIPNQTVKDLLNANTLPQTNNANVNVIPTQPPLVRDVNVNVETNNKNESTIKPPETVTKPLKNKIDITDIVREKPKNIKPYNSNSTKDGNDETDRAAISQSNEKMVQAKNDVNSKTSEISRIETKLPYTEGQWSPANQSGVKKYNRDFLLAAKDLPASKIIPDNIPDSVLADEKGRLSDGRLSMGGGRTDFNPSFNNYGRNSSQKGTLTNRLSGSKMDRGKGNKGGSLVKPPMKVSISVREEVKLHESENAWRPARFSKGEFQTEDDKKTEELYRKVRGILNKLTPQKFETLLQQIKNLSIDTTERLQGVIDLVFEKAVDEPNFSVAYASMCGQLALLQVPVHTGDKQEYVNFRKLLITRCQVEFEKQSLDESIRNSKIKEIEECTDPEKKKDLAFDLEEYDRRLRMKSVGNIRFIGELFKQNMLTVKIMMRCLENLLENKDEESYECLCKLLTTIGKELDANQSISLDSIFTQMKNIANKKDSTNKISSRIRFMLQDVIDLRASKWVPRRQDLNPKKIDQIQKEAEQEQLNIQMMNSAPLPSRKDDRGGMGNSGGPGGSKGGRSRNVTADDGWTMPNRGKNNSFCIKSDLLRGARTAPTADEPLGAAIMYNKWHMGAGTNVKTPSNQVNIYAALENIDGDRRTSSRQGQKEIYISKGTSLERGNYKYDSRSGSRSGSQHRSNDSSASSSQRGTPAPVSLPPQAAVSRSQPQQSTATTTPQATPATAFTEEQYSRRMINSLDEYVSGNSSLNEYFMDISSCVPVWYFRTMVTDSYLHVLEKSQQMRLKAGELFAKLVVQGKIPLDVYCSGLADILSLADDLTIDIPKFWDYVAEMLVDSIIEDAVPLKRLHKTFDVLIKQGKADLLLAPLFKLVISNKGSHFLHNQWQASNLQLSDFMDNSSIESFIRDNQLEFLLGGGTVQVDHNQLSFEEIKTKLSQFLATGRNIDEIHDWVMANLGEKGAKENKFIRALATAFFEDAINKNNKFIPDKIDQHNHLLLKYVDNKPGFELECLYALQALIHKMEHPRGLLLQICDKLYELGTFSQESFIAWEQSQDPAEQEGKGVALKQLTSFFCQLKENDDDDESSGSDPYTED